jgi:putative DNA primase/helicase
MFSLSELVRALGGEAAGGQVICPGPGHSPRDRSLCVRLSASAPFGFLCHSFAGDSFAECQAYICERLGLEPDGYRSRKPDRSRPASTNDDDQRKRAAALVLWDEGVDPRGTRAERYLAIRGLALDGDVAGEVLRWHARTNAMLALFRSIEMDEPRAISRTFLDRGARKLGRKFFASVSGCAVKFDADESVLVGLYIGEGIETCLSARQLGLRPCWAVGSADAVASFPVLAGIECLTLLAEHDDASARAVERCAARWHAAGREIMLNEPIGGKDLNDALSRRRRDER